MDVVSHLSATKRAAIALLFLSLVGASVAWFINKYFWIEEHSIAERLFPPPTVQQIELDHLRQIAGWFSQDCGHVPHRGDADGPIACANAALKARHRFYVSFDFVGIDDHGTIGIAANSKGAVYQVITNELGGGAFGYVGTGAVKTTVSYCKFAPKEQNVPPVNRFLSCD